MSHENQAGVIEHVHYEEDACTIHVDCGDGVHIARLDCNAVEDKGYRKGMKVTAHLNDAGDAVGLEAS